MTWEQFAADRAEMEAEIERLRAELSKSSNNFEKLSHQYHEARTRWQTKMGLLTEQNATMRAIVAAVAHDRKVVYWECQHHRFYCHCGGSSIYENNIIHAMDCPYEQARAFMASGQAAENERE